MEISKTKVKDFFVKNKMVLSMAFMTVLVLLANHNYNLWFLSMPALLALYSVSSLSEQMCYNVYMAVFSGVSPIYVSCLLSCFLVTTIRYIIDVKKGKKQFFKFQFFLTLFFVVIFSVIHGEIDIWGFFNWALITCLMFFAYYIFIYSREIDVKRCFKYLFWAIVVSVCLSACLFPIEQFKTIVYPFDGKYYRLKLFTNNVNQLAMFCLFEICYLVYSIINVNMKTPKSFEFLKSKDFWFKISKIAVVTLVGLLTLSKAFILMLAIVFLYIVVVLVAKLKVKSLIVIIPMTIIIALLGFIFKDFVYKLFSRFFAYSEWGSIYSKIFTGRTEIWAQYRDSIRGSIISMLFGAGLMTKDLIAIGPHNVFIYFAYRVGFVGIVMLIILIYSYAKDAKSKIKPTLFNSLLFVSYVVLALEEMIFSDRFFIFLIMGLLLMERQC